MVYIADSTGPSQRCRDPGTPANGGRTVSDNSFKVKTAIEFVCQNGYVLRGPSVIVCIAPESWDAPIPSCEPIAGCQDPGAPQNGDRRVSDPQFRTGTRIEFTCFQGYRLEGSNVINCGPSGSWDSRIPTCVQEPGPILPTLDRCADPGTPEYSQRRVSDPNFRINSRVEFTCSQGYILQGNSIITCTSFGLWDFGPPSCVADSGPQPPTLDRCADPGMPEFGQRRVSDPNFGINSRVEFTCAQDYILQGSNIIICTSLGLWDFGIPICLPDSGPPQPVDRCSDPGTPQFGQRRVSDPNFTINSRIEFACSQGYRLQGNRIITCTSSASWDNRLPTCIPDQIPPPSTERCQDPGTPEFAQRRVSDPSFRIYSRIEFSCANGYRIQGSRVISCVSPGRWDAGIPSCVPEQSAGNCV